MKFLYFVFNNFNITSRCFDFENSIPIMVSVKNYDTFEEVLGDTKHLVLEDPLLINIMQITVDDCSKKILRIKLVLSNQITFHKSLFNYEKYLTISSCITAELTKGSFEKCDKFLPNINYSSKIHIFEDSIIILINEDLCPFYRLIEDNFGILTDHNFNIIGFIIRNISLTTHKFLENYCAIRNSKSRYPNQESSFPFNTCETTIMENKKYLIKKINELENVDQWHVIYYGLERKLIDNKFIVDYAIFLLEQNKTTGQFTLDLASLIEHEIDQVSILIEQKITNKEEIMITKGQFYNKIWFYLSLAADMCAEKIIK